MSSPSKPAFVLVHGAWHVPSHLQPLSSLLEAAGFPVSVPQLPSSVLPSASPTSSLDPDIAAIRAAILPHLEAGRPCHLFAHSYGGIPTSAAVEGLLRGQRAGACVESVTYVSAFVVARGSSLQGSLGGGLPGWCDVKSEEVVEVVPDLAVSTFYADVEEEQAREAARKLRPMSLSGFTQEARYEPWKHEGVRVCYVLCEDDGAIPLVGQKAMVEAAGIGETVTLKASHSPFLSMPERVAEILLDRVGGVKGA